jgi:hypothetical protein
MSGNTHIEPPGTSDRYQTIVSMLSRILRDLDELKTDVDDIDRTLKPYGDGTRIRKPRR